MMPISSRRNLAALAAFALLLSACGVSLGPRPTATPAASAPPAFTATPPAPRVLTVCLGAEPNSLYPFADLNDAARSVLAAIDDGPIDHVAYDYQPVILQKLPSLADRDASISPVSVRPGSTVVDVDGNLVSLNAGARVHPAGCRSDACAIKYDGTSAIKMDQMVATFRLRSDVTWSDGTPLTADDSVYAYKLAADKDTPGSKFLVDRTQNYEATDATTVQWWGKPGFIDPTYFTNFWAPAPTHLWSQFRAAELPQVDVASRAPVGWGPYVLQEWVKGDHITLTRNPFYFRLSEGYPKFDRLVFRFEAGADAAISDLTAARCDLLDPSLHLDSQVGLLQQMQGSDQIQAFFVPGMSIEWLGLGILPASYDNGYDPSSGDRPNILADPRTRQAIASCLDRQKVAEAVLFGQSSVPNTFLPPDHPLYNNGVPSYRFDPAFGSQLLDEVGWKDLDGNPATPRLAAAVRNVKPGTPLLLNYYTTPAAQRRQVADILSKSLAQCGIGVNVQFYSQDDLYAPGPVGLLFGRRFDLIEYAMSTDSFEPPCEWFTTGEIPDAANHWVGTNVSGYQNADFDALCRAARLALPGEAGYIEQYRQTQAVFATDLPSIPLYFRLKVAAARADLCHFALDATANPMWNVEAFDEGQGCQP